MKKQGTIYEDMHLLISHLLGWLLGNWCKVVHLLFNLISVIDTLEASLYTDRSLLPKSGETLPGNDFRFSRLVPSHSDRAAFFSLVVEGHGIKSEFSVEEIGQSFQATTKRIFDRRIKVLEKWESRGLHSIERPGVGIANIH